MTTGIDIAFREILYDKVLRFRLDNLSVHLVLLGHGLKHPAPTLACCVVLFLMPLCFLAFSRARNLKEDHVHTRVALQALVTVVAPTCSLWPSRYIGLASVLRSHIEIPLEVIMKDTINGIMEFRNPSHDLADLIGSGANVNGHTIRIKIGWTWWAKYFEWWMFVKDTPTGQSKPDYPSLCSPGYILELSDWLHRNTTNPSPLNSSPSPFALTSSTSCPLFCLDCPPHGGTPSLRAGCRATLEFTTFSPSLGTLSAAQIISAIPFMISNRPRRWPRSLVSVLKHLGASFGPNMVIDSLSNVSVDYECALYHIYKSFSEEQEIRETWVKIQGIRAWRREMFLVALEAALVRRGWIERWAVQVIVK